MTQKLLLADQRRMMLANSAINASQPETPIDFQPVVKLFAPWGGATWLLTELDDDNIAFGLCDLGLGEPELGYVSLNELAAIRGRFGLKIERDAHFRATKTLSAYAAEARTARRIAA